MVNPILQILHNNYMGAFLFEFDLILLSNLLFQEKGE